MTHFSPIITIQSLNLFMPTQCETRLCLDARKPDILVGIEGGNKAYIPFKVQSLHYGAPV